jgi:hypothetical protein
MDQPYYYLAMRDDYLGKYQWVTGPMRQEMADGLTFKLIPRAHMDVMADFALHTAITARRLPTA